MEIYNLRGRSCETVIPSRETIIPKNEESEGSPSLALKNPADPEILSGGVVAALGGFDGVHVGHAELIRRAVELARERGLLSAVWTFADEISVIPSKNGMKTITPLNEKLALFRELGVDIVILNDFDSVRDYSAERFVKEILVNACSVKSAVCGFNFSFGRGGVGNSETLRALLPDCEVLPPIHRRGYLVSSSSVRKLISDGEIETANELLGRRFSIELPVVHGKELGRTIGIPTINQNPPGNLLIPKNGIYVTRIELGGESYPGVTNIGARPTVDKPTANVNLETHIIGYEGWLYDKNVRLSFCKRLRDEVKFADVNALRAQIMKDIDAARLYFEV